MSNDGVLRLEDIQRMVESWKTEPIKPGKEIISPTEYQLRLMGRSMLPSWMCESRRLVEQSIAEVATLYPDHSYSRIVEACSVLVARYPYPALDTLASLKGGSDAIVRAFMTILADLSAPAKVELVKDNYEDF